MTEENRRANAADELAEARGCLEQARVLAGLGHPKGAVSRGYYAVYHAARALLFSIGVEPRSHSGLVNLLGQHFVRPGQFPAELARLVSVMQRDREDADYQPGAVFTEEQGKQSLASAEAFLTRVERMLVGD